MYKNRIVFFKIMKDLGSIIVSVAGICGICLIGAGVFELAIPSILMGVVGIVIREGGQYIIEVEEHINESSKSNKLLDIPDCMKCNGSNRANDGFEKQPIYVVEPEKLGIVGVQDTMSTMQVADNNVSMLDNVFDDMNLESHQELSDRQEVYASQEQSGKKLVKKLM